MESLTINILNPKAKGLLENLVELNLITILEVVQDSKTDEQAWESLSKEQQDGILKAMQQIENGEGIPHETVMMEARKKLQLG
ncbi:hypothetical protein BCY91_05430 [Pelobium manganitolerans]|uniref:Uncharacterized protein n=1 Tax=Pelobium manganitolerans TaxID=1842495 RepID=A0A419S638_9SPHI|nr:hypothetical protein [Pelobium manganitolerans]RKD16312.1 hypothetical protein BCY91_05430 [Pelobium manganitolerans]